jgi:hypoxanthine-DNA glycosylase
MTRHASFAPIVDARTRTLILGSLPGAASLAAGRYYANPRNQFWRLVGDAIGVALEPLAYRDRLATLLSHGIGLWDVIASAERPGSLDAAIRDADANDLARLVDTLPRLATIAFNGATAARIGTAALGSRATGLRLLRLPSSSPAHTLSIDRKGEAWRALSVD